MAAEAPLRMRKPFEGSSSAACRAWQVRFASKLRELLGPHQPPAQRGTILERAVDLDDHRREECCCVRPVTATFQCIP
jgi:hypothetical protein